MFQFPDAEKAGVIKDARRKNAFDPALDALDGIPVQHPHEDPVLGNPEGFRQCFLGVLHEFQGGKKTDIIKGIVIKRKVLGITAV